MRFHPRIAGLPVIHAALLALLSVCALLAACARDDDADGRTTIELWTLALKPNFTDYMQRQIAAFESEHPDLRVNWVDVPYDALDRKLIAAAAANRAPDVVNMADLNFGRFAALGAFEDLAPLLPGDADAQYIPGALRLMRMNGQLLGVPWYVNPQSLLVNTQLLEQGGLSADTLPRDWSQLAALARDFRDRTGEYLFTQPLGEESQLPIMMLADGLSPLTPREDGALRANLTDPAIRDYLAQWVDLYRSGALPREAARDGHAHLTRMFQEGKVAVINTGPNFLTRIKDVAPSVYQHSRAMPGATGRLNRVHMPVMVLSVLSQSQHPEAAAKLAWFLTGPQAQLEFCKEVAILPSASAALTDPFFRGETGTEGVDPKLLEARIVAAETLTTAAAFTPAIETWPDLRRVFDDGMKRVLIDGADLDTTLAQINTEWDRLLAAAAPVTMDAVPTPPPVPVPVASASCRCVSSVASASCRCLDAPRATPLQILAAPLPQPHRAPAAPERPGT